MKKSLEKYKESEDGNGFSSSSSSSFSRQVVNYRAQRLANLSPHLAKSLKRVRRGNSAARSCTFRYLFRIIFASFNRVCSFPRRVSSSLLPRSRLLAAKFKASARLIVARPSRERSSTAYNPGCSRRSTNTKPRSETIPLHEIRSAASRIVDSGDTITATRLLRRHAQQRRQAPLVTSYYCVHETLLRYLFARVHRAFQYDRNDRLPTFFPRNADDSARN